MIKLHEVHKVYLQGKIGYHALKDIKLYFEKGEFVSIFGPSGCGKTTLLNIIGGLDTPTSGNMVIDDRLTTEFVEREWDYFRNHRIGFVFQQYNLIEHLPIVENVALSVKLGGVKASVAREKAIELLKKVGLENHLHKLPGELSGGERQRVAIARALINDPDVILADEPTGALDNKTGREVMDLIKSVCSDKLVIVVTHNRKLADEYSTRIIELKDGRVVSDTAPKDQKVRIRKEKSKLRKKLSFKEAIRLSYYNIKGKKWRTLLVSLGLSIGVVGLILVDALFNSARAGLAQQESIVNDNPDVYITVPYEAGDTVSDIHDEISSSGYFKEVLYSPNTPVFLDYNVTNDSELTTDVFSTAIEYSNLPEIKDTFTTLVGDSRFPENDNEILITLSQAKSLVNSNVTLTNLEIWETLKGNKYTLQTEYDYKPDPYDLNAEIVNGTCIVTEYWDGDVTQQPDGYDDLILGDLDDNFLALQEHRQSPLHVGTTGTIFCADYSTVDWMLDYDTPVGDGVTVTVVGIHDSRLFTEFIVSDNIINSIKYQPSYIMHDVEPNEETISYYRFRAFITNDQVENKVSIIKDLEDNYGYSVSDNFGEINIFAGITELFTYILQFIFSCIVFIAVVTGALMLLLILLISILERSREIGLIRAMGGTRSDVRVIYTGETTIIGLLAGVFSIILSMIAVVIVNNIIYNNYFELVVNQLPYVDPKHVLTLNYPKLVWAIVGSIGIAILSGLIPSIRAGRKKPIEALRNE